jgi:outer membrane lipoprotein-sorting protein
MPHIDRRHVLIGLLGLSAAALAASPLPVAAQAVFDLGQLTQLLATVKAGSATFTEKRSVTMLERTLESSGRLSFEAPDTFVRETLKPRQERMAVIGNQVTMSLGSRSRTVPLDSVPEASVIVEAIRGTLTGNREVLDRNFTANVSGNAARWTLELLPRAPRLRELVVSVRVSGQQALVREVTVAMADGDRSVMTITPAPATANAASAAGAASAPN